MNETQVREQFRRVSRTVRLMHAKKPSGIPSHVIDVWKRNELERLTYYVKSLRQAIYGKPKRKKKP